MGDACGDEEGGDSSRCWRRAPGEVVVNRTEMDLSVAMKSEQVEYATSVFGEGLITLIVNGGKGSMEVAHEWRIKRDL